MSAKRTIFNQRRGKQYGAVLMVMLIIMIIGAITIFVSSLNSSTLQIERDKVTADALAKARVALMGRAVADGTSPGSLPCPDTNNDGSAQLLSGSNCPSYIGRLPWKTLGLADLRDGSGERLWYALSPNFRDYVNPTTPSTTNPINSNSKGTLLVYDNSGITLLTPPGSEAVAIVFSPGDVNGSQQRDTANQNLAQNYLDVGPSSINNYTAAGPFIAADKTKSFNDRLLIIKASDIISLVETRMEKELTTSFATYLSLNHTYPHPANFTNCTSAGCPSDMSQCIGNIPATEPSMAAVLPPWFTPNHWFEVIYYSVGTKSLTPYFAGNGSKGRGKGGIPSGGLSVGAPGTPTPPGGTGCYATTLSVSGTNVNALFILPGTPLNMQSRTGTNAILGPSSSNLTQYFEDTENANLDNVYVIPSSSSNDSLDALP
jgi:hypothetical protein